MREYRCDCPRCHTVAYRQAMAPPTRCHECDGPISPTQVPQAGGALF